MSQASEPSQSELNAAEPSLMIGQQLRCARELAGLSLEELSHLTAVPLRHLLALEEGAPMEVAPTFVAGYLRRCAQYLDLRAEELIEQYGCNVAERQNLAADSAVVNRRLGLFSGSSWSSRLSLPWSVSLPRPLSRGIWLRRHWRVAALLLLLVLLLWPLLQRQDGGVVSAVNDAVVSPLAVAIAPVGTPPVEAPSEAMSPELVTAVLPLVERQSLSPQDQLLIEVGEDSWIDIRDSDDQRLYRDLARAGARIEVYGQLPFFLHVGNAPGLTLQLNGAPFAITGYRADNSARLTLKP